MARQKTPIGVVLIGLLIVPSLLAGCLNVRQHPVSPAIAGSAYESARAKLGSPYVYGGRGPDTFDCSGLITWAYRQAVPDFRLRTAFGTADDATIRTLYRWNYQLLPAEDLVPGDLVFLSDDSGEVVHGGLVGSVSEGVIYFINASSYWEQVVEDSWPLEGEKRGQRIAGYGRLLISTE